MLLVDVWARVFVSARRRPPLGAFMNWRFRNRDSLDGPEYEQEPERSAGLQAATDRFGGQFGPVGDPELGEHV
jgi:hypothetical protein